MKIVILIFLFAIGVGASVKKSAEDIKEISVRQELNQLKSLPNLLPEVEIVAPRI
ncbi:hypothetical protein [Pontibacter oryzae]|uniref:hypothetical protein n=1 Tax=Pontibacter oryzae TaxID=2304593 RepID=UPI00131523E0|nr:hypothetical protein [Pontibacter oryzae]